MATFETPDQLRRRLRKSGLTTGIIDAAWPQWWSNDLVGSPSAEAELRFSLARNLGLSPRSLVEDGAPTFLWHDSAKFKRLKTDPEGQSVLASFGRSVATAIDSGMHAVVSDVALSAAVVRSAILASDPCVSLPALLTLAWGLGVPVVYLRIFPLAAKHMDAMSVVAKGRPVILLARETNYLSSLAFTVAHELGHIALGHVHQGQAIIDEGEPGLDQDPDDEEVAADRYALELLTGDPHFSVEVPETSFTATQLADAALREAELRPIDPGVIALSAAFGSGRWNEGYGALKVLNDRAGYAQYDDELASSVNQLAVQQLDLSSIRPERGEFVRGVLGVA